MAYPRLRRPVTVLMPISKSTFGWMMKFPSLIGWQLQDNRIKLLIKHMHKDTLGVDISNVVVNMCCNGYGAYGDGKEEIEGGDRVQPHVSTKQIFLHIFWL